jgi:hypothetical protein
MIRRCRPPGTSRRGRCSQSWTPGLCRVQAEGSRGFLTPLDVLLPPSIRLCWCNVASTDRLHHRVDPPDRANLTLRTLRWTRGSGGPRAGATSSNGQGKRDRGFRGAHLNPLGLFSVLTHLHTVYMAYSECLPTSLNPLSETDAKSAQKLGQLQPCIAVFLLEYMGQLASFGPT